MLGALTRPQLTELIEIGETYPYIDLLQAAPESLRRKFGLRHREVGHGIALNASGVPMFLLNRVFGIGILETATEKDIAELVAFYRESGVEKFGVQIAPGARPMSLSHWLIKAGFERKDNWTKFYRSLDDVDGDENELNVRRINATAAEPFAAIVGEAFNAPESLVDLVRCVIDRDGWYHYIAYADDEPVGAAAMFVRDELAWLGWAGTRKEQRRKGAQNALIAKRLRDAKAIGCKYAITETVEDTPEKQNPSAHNVLRAGFQIVYQRANFVYRFLGRG